MGELLRLRINRPSPAQSAQSRSIQRFGPIPTDGAAVRRSLLRRDNHVLVCIKGRTQETLHSNPRTLPRVFSRCKYMHINVLQF